MARLNLYSWQIPRVWNWLWGFSVHWKDIVLLCVMLAGLILFLHGANYYNALLGWTGVCLFMGGFLVGEALIVCRRVRKREVD
jgi:hypothetical protein